MKKLVLLLAILCFVYSCKDRPGKNAAQSSTSGGKKSAQKHIPKIAERKKTETDFNKPDTLIKTSAPFVINGVKCYWKIGLIVYPGDENGDITLELKNLSTNKIILSSFDEQYDKHAFNTIDFENLNKDNLEDLNFDGYKDFSFFDKAASGTAGTYYRAYIFNSKKQLFEFIEDLSGYGLTANVKDKTLSTYGKNGAYWNLKKIHHFGKGGKIRYTEITKNEVISIDTKRFLKTTYERIVDDQIIKIKIDTNRLQ
jgi:hypothetical protein